MEHIYRDITIIICVSAFFTILFRYIKQPSILAYILTGIILGFFGVLHHENEAALKALGQLGITLLLFILGLELKLRELRSIGKTALLGGVAQMILTGVLAFGVCSLLGFDPLVSIIVALGLSFSSTIVIVKLLSDKKDLTSLHGKIAIGVLLVQDFFAVLTIIFLTGFKPGVEINYFTQVLLVLLKVGVLFGWIFVVSTYVFPRIIPKISRSSEVLFLFSLAWVFLLTAIVTSPFVGFSIEIGGFLAGLALANTKENFQIVARMKALRDFFITIFFVLLGLEMSFANVASVIVPALLLTLFVLFIKPFVIMFIVGLLGFRKRTSFLVGTSMAQVSEFSLIILFLGQQMNIIPERVITMMVLVAMMTFVGSTYFIQNGKKIYTRFSKKLSFLELRRGKSTTIESDDEYTTLTDHVVVIGAHQMGKSILRALENSGEEVLVVDFDPNVVDTLRSQGIKILFGDIADPDIQERLGVGRAKLVISTVPDMEDNLLLIESLKHVNKDALIVVMAVETLDAQTLYNAGADYVILPHLAGGRHLAKILLDKKHLELIDQYKKKDLSALS
jgi:Kef-type K+ transport system membrane component KefB